MARSFRFRRRFRRYRKLSRRTRSIRRRMLIRRRVKRFVNKMGYPSYVKMIGMTESKRLLLRKTLTLKSSYSTTGEIEGGNPSTNIFQIVLNPLECPNIKQAFKAMDIVGKDEVNQPYNNVFKYDYIRIKSIFISIKPAQNVSANNADGYSNGNGDTGISNVYAYFTYRFPLLAYNDEDAQITKMYGTNPIAQRIIQEGRLKNTYSWPSNKSMTISLNKLYYRVISEPYKLCSNTPLDLQYLSTLCPSMDGVYNPFEYARIDDENGPYESKNKSEDKIEDYECTEDVENLNAKYKNTIDIPDLTTKSYDLFFGRLVIISPKQIRFTTEICYDCLLLR